MGFEFSGSLFVFALLALGGTPRSRGLVYAAVGAVLLGLGHAWLLEFLAGVALCDLSLSPRVARGAARRTGALAAVALVAAGLCLGGFSPAWFAASTGWPEPRPGVVRPLQHVGAVLLLAGVLGAPDLRRALSVRPLAFLGRISFPLYLVHMPVQCSLGCRVYLECVQTRGLSHGLASAGAAAATLSASLLLAWVGSRTVEPLSIWLGRTIYRVAFAPSSLTPSPRT